MFLMLFGAFSHWFLSRLIHPTGRFRSSSGGLQDNIAEPFSIKHTSHNELRSLYTLQQNANILHPYDTGNLSA